MKIFRQGSKNPELIYLDPLVPDGPGVGANWAPSGKGELVLTVNARSLNAHSADEFARRVVDHLNRVCWTCPPECTSCPRDRGDCECYEHDEADRWIQR